MVFVPLSAVENSRWPWWDTRSGPVGRLRSGLAGSAVALSGALVLAHSQTGLNPPGPLLLVAAAVLALTARALVGAGRPVRGGSPQATATTGA